MEAAGFAQDSHTEPDETSHEENDFDGVSPVQIIDLTREKEGGAGDGDRTRDIKLGKLAFYR